MNDYERIADIIRHIDACHTEQPDLASLAGRAGLSPSHFHRLFSTWAGITPKDFLQCLTVAHVKELLRQGESVLDASLDAGLSGPGRAHDLCVTIEAASPGELKSGGAGWQIAYGFAASPFGRFLVAESPRGICHLSFVDDAAAALDELRAAWHGARLRRSDALARELSGQIFQSAAARQNVRAYVRGTAFQVRVWRALLQVPRGSAVTYGRLAAAVGRPAASRAVGTAVGRNELACLVPCHRVIRETGIIGGYRWGPVRKRAMLAWESC